MIIYVHIAFYGHSRAIFTIKHDLSDKSKPHMVEQYKFVYILSNTNYTDLIGVYKGLYLFMGLYNPLWVFIGLYGLSIGTFVAII